jgi:hypothetical protein
MSLETDELNQPNDGDDTGGRHRFGFRHADTGVDEDGVDEDGVNRDIDDEAVADDDVDTDDAVNTGTVYDSTGDPVVVDTDNPQPTFTPADSEADTTMVPEDGQVVQGEVVADEVVEDDVTVPDSEYQASTLDDTSTVPDSAVPDSAVVNDAVPAREATAPPVAAFDANAPLLGDSVTLKASWQQAAAEFVDDPRAAVAEAAELVEHTAQTLVGALQQRQRQLRGQWESGTATGVNGSNGTTDQAGDTVDTEELRHLMQSYRALFNQLCTL